MNFNSYHQKANNEFHENLKEMDGAGVLMAADKGQEKYEKFNGNPPKGLADMWEDIKLIISLLKDYTSGQYRDIRWKSIAIVAAAVVYFISPIDAIPDFIPGLGYLDDAAVIAYALYAVKDDFANYKFWKK